MTTPARPLAPAPERSRHSPEPVARRDFLGLAALASALAALGFAALGSLKLARPSVSPTPARKFKVTLPETLAPGEPFLPPGRNVALFRDSAGAVYAVSRVCTHLGCIVRPSPAGFDCPCHGSRFSADGAVKRGPAPKALAWHPVTKLGANAYLVDEGRTVAPGTRVA
ncbi:MAG TPA: Rieske 2Fe-2S domain-containing protein [Anaeromyxobacteraceae bacterium]|nr:Rieske 2Fe-2S domain-containing protein [Anaeromyxobacteraceae bacterium]